MGHCSGVRGDVDDGAKVAGGLCDSVAAAVVDGGIGNDDAGFMDDEDGDSEV